MKKILKGITVLLLCVVVFQQPDIQAQSLNYPPVYPNETYENRTGDTLIIFTLLQARNAFKTFEKNKNLQEQNDLLNSQVENLHQQIQEKDTIIYYLRGNIDSYKTITEGCEEHAYEMREEARRQARLKTLSLIGIAVAFVAGLLI